jgi:hypothetical protein
MDTNDTHSRRYALKRGAAISTAGILTSLAGCQDVGGPNTTPGDEEEGEKDEDGETGDNESLDVSYQEFADRALINPEEILQEVIGDDEFSQETYETRQGFEIDNVVSMMNELSAENQRYLNENMQDNLPWSVFNAEIGDMKMIANDNGDGTETALLDFSMEEALEGLESRQDIEVLESTINNSDDDFIEFGGDHEPYLVEKEGYDPFYVHGFVVPTDIGVMATTADFGAPITPIADGNNEVTEVARKHLELMRRNGYSLLDQDTEEAAMAEYVLNRAEGVSEDRPASDSVSLAYFQTADADPLSIYASYQEDGLQVLSFSVVEQGEGYESIEVEEQTRFIPIEEHPRTGE